MLEAMALQAAVRMGDLEGEIRSPSVRYAHHVTRETETPLPYGMGPLLMPDLGTQGPSATTSLSLLIAEAQTVVDALPVGHVDPEDDALIEALIEERVSADIPRRLTRRISS